MKTNQTVERDERTEVVENASYRWVCIFLTYALLVDACYRGIVYQEAAWDLLAMVIAAGSFSAIYLNRERAMPRNWVMKAVILASVAAIIGAIVATFWR